MRTCDPKRGQQILDAAAQLFASRANGGQLSYRYVSPMADGGYDVADYRAIDPTFGTLADAGRDDIALFTGNDDAIVADVPVLTDLSNQWKRLAQPVEIAYREHLVEQMPWQVLLN